MASQLGGGGTVWRAESGEGNEACVLTVSEGAGCAGDLHSLWLSGALCDVALLCGDEAAPAPLLCHRVVLAAASPFFRAVFAGAGVWRECGAPELRLHGVSHETLRALVSCVYTGTLHVSPRTVAPLLAGAAQLALLKVAESLRHLLRARLCPASALATAALATAHGDAGLAEAALACAASNFAAVLAEDAPGWAALPPDRLAALLASDALAAAAEADVLRALLAWAAAEEAPDAGGGNGAVAKCADAGQPATPPREGRPPGIAPRRAHALEALLPLVRLRLVPRAALAEACNASEDMGAGGAAALLRRVVAEPERHRGGGATGTVVHDDASGSACCAACCAALGAASSWAGGAAARWGTPRASAPLRLLAMGGHNGGWISHRGCEVYDVRSERWDPAPSLPFAVSFLAAARAGGGADGAPAPLLAVAGGNFGVCQACQSAALPAPLPFAADPDAPPPSAVLPWTPAPAPPTPRVHAALACAGDALFLLGGRAGSSRELDVVERYDTAAAAWTSGLPRMRAPRASLGAAAVGDALFAVGGQAGRETFASVDVLDVATGAWLAAPPMASPRKYGAVAALRGCVVAVGGMNAARTRTASAEALDPREGKWRALAPLPAPRSSAAVAVAAGCLFLAGGNDGEETHAATFKYDPAANAWQPVTPMSVPRTGAALVAL